MQSADDADFHRLEDDGASDKDDIWASYDPEKARVALQKSVGALHGVDREELLADIHAAREQDSRGRPA